MSLGLTVVTHFNPTWNRDSLRCRESVRRALPENANHVFLSYDGDSVGFQKARFETMNFNDVVIFVDDDDYISEDSLRGCLEALESSDYGIAFTREIRILQDNTCQGRPVPLKTREITKNPEIVHHMTAIRTKYVTEDSLQLALRYNSNIEWILKYNVARKHGAIHVPIDGYYWVQHINQFHKSEDQININRINMHKVGNEMAAWPVIIEDIRFGTLPL